jgi:hypothetical protein
LHWAAAFMSGLNHEKFKVRVLIVDNLHFMQKLFHHENTKF